MARDLALVDCSRYRHIRLFSRGSLGVAHADTCERSVIYVRRIMSPHTIIQNRVGAPFVCLEIIAANHELDMRGIIARCGGWGAAGFTRVGIRRGWGSFRLRPCVHYEGRRPRCGKNFRCRSLWATLPLLIPIGTVEIPLTDGLGDSVTYSRRVGPAYLATENRAHPGKILEPIQ